MFNLGVDYYNRMRGYTSCGNKTYPLTDIWMFWIWLILRSYEILYRDAWKSYQLKNMCLP